MLRVGLTGGIGSGKSTVARRVQQLGAVLIDADVIARDVVEPGTAGFEAVVDEFGPEVVTPEGGLDRAALGRVVFADTKRREALNAIVHPLVYQRRQELVARATPGAIVVEGIPLLVENQLGAGYHLVVVVHAPAEERVRRLVTDRGMAEDDAWSRVRAQADDETRRAAADVWLDNSGSVEDLLAGLDAVWSARIVPFARNLGNRKPAPLPAPGDVVAYDDTWPLEAKRIIARITAAGGDDVLRADHVGATAVPGMVARDVIDVLLTVREDDVPEDLGKALHLSGFPEFGSEVGSYASADPGRPVLVRVAAAGSLEQRVNLLLRDWLRTNAGERDSYNRWERERGSTEDTTARKDRAATQGWWGQAYERAETWAAQSGWQV